MHYAIHFLKNKWHEVPLCRWRCFPLIGRLANEGSRENPALFRFINCSHLVALNPGLATPDVPYTYTGGKHADGMLFDNCSEFAFIQPFEKIPFTQLGDYTARGRRDAAMSALSDRVSVTRCPRG
jgi:hypothetical protein